MLTKDKIFTIVTFAMLFFSIIEFLFNNKYNKNNINETLKEIPTRIVFTDSSGKKDTLNSEQYIKKSSSK